MIKVLIADDSAFLRQILKYELEKDPYIRVIAEAMNGKEAIKEIKRISPDVLILDCIMPVMSGLEALEIIMRECPLPVILFSTLAKEGADVTIRGLELGALDFVTKPAGSANEVKQVIDGLIEMIKTFCKVKEFKVVKKTVEESRFTTTRKKVDIIGLASSAGGVQASLELIPKLSTYCPPIVWVQHMPENFTLSFAKRLDTLSKIKVKEAQNNDKLMPGQCLLAPGGLQMTVKRVNGDDMVRVFNGEKVSGHKPSCDLLLDSVASLYRADAIGIILTGMGDDGAKGMLSMRSNGAFTIGQNEETCTVYSMPKVANDIGGINIELPLTEIIKQVNLLIGN